MSGAGGIDLGGRVMLITGASSGLGLRFGRVAARSGARVILAARRVDRLDEAVKAIRDEGGSAIAIPLDVTSEQSTLSAYDQAESAFGPIDTIIANAGINQSGMAVDLPAEEFDSVVATNLRGVFLTVREGARRIMSRSDSSDGPERQGKDGRIVIISSVTATKAGPGLAVYSATKAGVAQMGRVFAREWIRSGINVNILCPGYVETDLTRDWFASDSGQRLIAKFPRRRVMREDSLDGLLLYLSSDLAAYVTGSVFTIDDGQTL